jgi:hypothetical protein
LLVGNNRDSGLALAMSSTLFWVFVAGPDSNLLQDGVDGIPSDDTTLLGGQFPFGVTNGLIVLQFCFRSRLPEKSTPSIPTIFTDICIGHHFK